MSEIISGLLSSAGTPVDWLTGLNLADRLTPVVTPDASGNPRTSARALGSSFAPALDEVSS